MREHLLHGRPRERKHTQQQARSHKYYARKKGIGPGPPQESETRFQHQPHSHRGCRQHGVTQKPEKRIQQQEPVVLQQNKKGQRKSGMVQCRFSRPSSRIMLRAEMRERNRKQKQHHRPRQPRASTTFSCCLPHQRPRREQPEPERNNQDCGVVQPGSPYFADVQCQSSRAHHVARFPDKPPLRPQRDVQQNRR